jgi:cell wall assembly regulator SMI1
MIEITFDASPHPRPTEANLTRLEKKLGYSLPEDFRAFLLTKGYGQPVEDLVIRVEDAGEDVMLQQILGFDKDISILSQTSLNEDDLPEGFIIFATDPGGSKFLMDLSEGEPTSIYYWDRLQNFDSSDEDENTYEIAGSFTQFLEKLRAME